MDCPPGIEGFGIRNFAKSVDRPCILVAPHRPKGSWWVLNRGGDFGYIDGDLKVEAVKAFVEWMQDLCEAALEEGSVDGKHPRALGFSAGAYALTEILAHAHREPLLWCLALGGLHGHGQPEADDIQGHWRQEKAMWNFDAYLERLRWHPGVPGGFFCFHHPEDSVCPWRHARKIAEVLDARQTELGFEAMEIEELWTLDKTSRSTTARQLAQGKKPQMHGYQDTAFLRQSFLQRLLQAAEGRNGRKWRSSSERKSRSRSQHKSAFLVLKPRADTAPRSRSLNGDQRRRDHSDDSRDGRRRRKLVRLVARR